MSEKDTNSKNPLQTQVKAKYDKQEIEDKLKGAGFETIDKTFYRNVDKELQIAAVEQIESLENKYGAISSSISPSITASAKGPVAKVRRSVTNPARQDLHLSSTKYKNKKEHFVDRKEEVKSGVCMPCKLDDETLSKYVVTHEYGHMLENVCVADDMKKYYRVDHEDACKKYKQEIETIAKTIDSTYDSTKYISDYGAKNEKEFFAECFANSQLGEPNVLGQAMLMWLKGRGY